jgi:hypothetical protein
MYIKKKQSANDKKIGKNNDEINAKLGKSTCPPIPPHL